MWRHLDLGEIDPLAPDALRRAALHLGDYIEQIVRPLNMRPTGADLIACDDQRIEVRVRSASGHVVIVIGSDADLAAELFWMRQMAARNLPVRRLVAHDLSNALVPFSFLVLAFVGGTLLDQQHDEALLRVAARQVGRSIRRAHQITTPGFGRPTATGRWPTQTWPEVLYAWLGSLGAVDLAQQLPSDLANMLWEATLVHPEIAEFADPRLIHGALGPRSALVTSGDGTIQLETLARTGSIIAGDPLLDVAMALLPSRPAAFRQGFLDGYASIGPLDLAQRLVLRRIGVLALLADAAQHHQSLDEQDRIATIDQLSTTIATELRLLEA
ncbi:MAG: aminoglycoside phosphotransferase family protein [Roseiflexaceae bacterium]